MALVVDYIECVAVGIEAGMFVAANCGKNKYIHRNEFEFEHLRFIIQYIGKFFERKIDSSWTPKNS